MQHSTVQMQTGVSMLAQLPPVLHHSGSALQGALLQRMRQSQANSMPHQVRSVTP